MSLIPTPARRAAVFFALLACFAMPIAAQGSFHILQKGETLFAIAKKYDISIDVLLAVNDIEDPNKIKIGQKLLIPETHKVAKGETLFGIAKSYGIDVEAFRAANKLGDASLIKPGDRLIIPSRDRAAGAAPGATPETAAAAGAIGAAASSAPASSSGSTPASSSAAVPAASPAKPTETATSAKVDSVALSPSKPPPASFPAPPPVRLSSKPVDMKLSWPCPGEAAYLDGKLVGVMIRARAGDAAVAVASGTVVSAGLFRGYSQVAIVQSRTGQLYVYGGNESLSVAIGDRVRVGQELGLVGADPKQGSHVAYFFVYKKSGEALDPALAPRD